MRIGLTSIYVDDQDRAERFYTEVLGFQVKTSAPYSDTERWLSVVAPEEPDGVELVLHLAAAPARAFQAASRELGRPVLSLRTDDCQGEAERLNAKGGVRQGAGSDGLWRHGRGLRRHLRQSHQPSPRLTTTSLSCRTAEGNHVRITRHHAQVGAQRRQRQLAAVDGHDLHPDAVTRGGVPPGR
jgi:catechol 2,3-dioxygenase-like lactoylglutathione lyase family enzyme